MQEFSSARASIDSPFDVVERRRLVQQLSREIADARVLEAMGRVPRQLFVPEELRGSAYENRALSIGYGQTISQPLMVALMLQAAELQGDERVLDVGSGSGYQTALLSLLCQEVYAIELLPELVVRARRALERLGVNNVTLIQGDGTRGYEAAAPYDVILVAAADQQAPQPLVDQLSEGGRLLIPLGSSFGQVLVRLRKRGATLEQDNLDPCAFVPLVHAS